MRLVCSAIIQPNGKIYTGKRHHDCIRVACEAGESTPISGKQGFMTDNNVFVDRKEALRIAEAAGQIIKKHGSEHELYSEDVWQ